MAACAAARRYHVSQCRGGCGGCCLGVWAHHVSTFSCIAEALAAAVLRQSHKLSLVVHGDQRPLEAAVLVPYCQARAVQLHAKFNCLRQPLCGWDAGQGQRDQAQPANNKLGAKQQTQHNKACLEPAERSQRWRARWIEDQPYVKANTMMEGLHALTSLSRLRCLLVLWSGLPSCYAVH